MQSLRPFTFHFGKSIPSGSGQPVAGGRLRRGSLSGRCAVRFAPVVVAVAVASLAVVDGMVEPAAAAQGRSGAESTLLSQAAEDGLAREFSAVLSLRDAPDSTCLSVRVDDRLIFQSKSDVRLVPASLMKIVTASAALEVMRPTDVYKTEVFVRADAMAAVTDGVLKGDVYLVGQGDPVLSTPRYIERFPEPVAHTDITALGSRVAAALEVHGITRVEGRVVGDDTWFADRERDYTTQFPDESSETIWKRSFVTLNTVGPLSGLLLNDGFSSYSWSSSSAGRRSNVRAANPAQHAASVFDDLLEARGFVITKRPASGIAPSPADRTSVGFIESPPLSEILIRILSRSDNTAAEMLLKETGRRTAGSARSSAVASVQEIMQRKLGPLAEGLVVADGSGLSSHNRLTCAAIVELLSQAGPGSPLVEGLSVAGERGTLRSCPAAVAGSGQHYAIRAKTGTLNHSTALAGTAVAADGQILTFAMMANRPFIIGLGSCNSIRRGVLNAVARYTYRDLPPNGPVHAGDREALEALFDATGGDAWFNVWGWNTDSPLSRWHGVTTDAFGRVTEIDLSGAFGNGLTGTLPEMMGALTELTRLDLSGNRLSGGLPRALFDSTKLRELQLSGTGLCVSRRLQLWNPWFGEMSGAGVPICTSFVDTFRTDYAEPIEELAARGILEDSECAESYICPEEPIDRSTFAVWMTRILVGDEPAEVSDSRFVDVDPESWWAAHVEQLAVFGITAGCAIDPPRYCPEAIVTQGQAATFLTRALDLLYVEPPAYVDISRRGFEHEIDVPAITGLSGGCAVEPPRYCPVTRGQAAIALAQIHLIHAVKS